MSKPKTPNRVRSSELVRPRRCRHRKCEAEALTDGLCCQHFLEALDKFEAMSRKAKGIVARSNIKLCDVAADNLKYKNAKSDSQ